MKRNLLLFCCLFSFFGAIVAQDLNSKQGYIITLAGDSITGMVKDKTTLNTVVSFKGVGKSDYIDYRPDEIKSFYFEGGYHYESLSSSEIDRRFFLRVFKGTLSLYQHKDTLYILTSKNEFMELKHHKDQTVQEKNSEERSTKYRLVGDKRYVRTLVYLTSDCPKIKGKMENVPYTAADIWKLLREYELCVNPDAKVEDNNIARTRLMLGFRAGASTSRLNYYVDSNYNLYYDHRFENQGGYVGGISLNVSYGKNFSVQPEIVIANRRCFFEGRLYESPGAVKRIYYDTNRISITHVQIPVTVYYTFSVSNLSPYIGLGGSFSQRISDKSTRAAFRTTDDPFGPDSDYSVLQRDPITSSDLLGTRAVLGIQRQLDSSRELRLEYTFDSSLMNRTMTNDKARWQTHQLSVCYMFGLN